ncbi:MAG: YdcF family protein [Defluviitaleaceae bacterium]|nr:YdcF family protein [Defluviitaleaceae bacterium]
MQEKKMDSRAKFRFKILVVFAVLTIFGIIGIVTFFGIQSHIKRFAAPFIVSLEDAPEVDAILVLGAFVHPDGRVSGVLYDRLTYALRLFEAGKAEVIIVSGDHGQTYYDEVNAMRNWLLDRGVPREKIFMDHAGFNTYDSMYRASLIFRVESIIISTQNFHIYRAIYIARRLGLKAYGYPSPDRAVFNMRANNTRESLARVRAFLDVEIVRRGPRFRGDEIPFWTNGILTEG